MVEVVRAVVMRTWVPKVDVAGPEVGNVGGIEDEGIIMADEVAHHSEIIVI